MARPRVASAALAGGARRSYLRRDGTGKFINHISVQRQAARPPCRRARGAGLPAVGRLRSEEHTSELQSLMRISYAVFCLKKKKKQQEAQIQNSTDTRTHYILPTRT